MASRYSGAFFMTIATRSPGDRPAFERIAPATDATRRASSP